MRAEEMRPKIVYAVQGLIQQQMWEGGVMQLTSQLDLRH